ncbi:MAG: hypothetical protein U0Q18_17830 [Bryobacteraceae bacterium]
MARSSQGEMRVDSGNTGLITKPGAAQAILLDHAKKEARMVPAPPVASTPHLPGMPPPPVLPVAPHVPAQSPAVLDVKDLGKQFIAGHEAEGKQYTIKPPEVPKFDVTQGMMPKGPSMPGPPKAPGIPKIKAPAIPQPPGLPKPPALPQGLQAPKPPAGPGASLGKPPAPSQPPLPNAVQTMEVWTSTKLKVPMLTKIAGGPAPQTAVCKQLVATEPPAHFFQVPQGYKLLQPPAPPKAPGLPKV